MKAIVLIPGTKTLRLVERPEAWGDSIGQLITHRFHYSEFIRALSLRSEDEIKTVLEWEKTA